MGNKPGRVKKTKQTGPAVAADGVNDKPMHTAAPPAPASRGHSPQPKPPALPAVPPTLPTHPQPAAAPSPPPPPPPPPQPAPTAVVAPAAPATQPAATPATTTTAPTEHKQDRIADLNIKEDTITGEYLRNVPLLGKLTSKERAKLGGCLETRMYKAGERIVCEGDIADGFYIVQEGEVAVCRFNRERRAEDELAHLKPGDYFGEAALLATDSKRGATVVAFSLHVRCWFLNNKHFYALFDKSRLNIQFAKRQAISAERADDRKERAAIPPMAVKTKSHDQLELILNAVHENILFAHLLPEHKQAVAQEMYRVDCHRGDHIIRQGDKGDHFYVVESGEFQISINGQVVAARTRGTCFGELALMYNAPRAATVTALTDAILWAVDRFTFRRVVTVLGNTKLRLYQDFLKKVELLAPLAEYERERIAEALEEQLFPPNHVVMRQGDEGNCMFIVHTGEVLVTKSEPGKAAVEVGRLKQGDCFGERALLMNEPRAATCTSVGSCLCLRLDAPHFKALMGPLEDILHKRMETYDSNQVAPSKPPSTLLKIPFSDLRAIGTLGKGSFGHVTLVREKSNGRTFALKAVSKAQIVQTGQQAHIMSEKRSMLVMDHPFLVKLFGTYKDAHRLYLLLELCLGGELFTVLRSRTLFDEDTARFYAAHVVLAFEYMHSLNIVYRDLKPENLMLDKDGYLKVTDFGFAKELGPNGRTWTLCGTPDYLAPEIVTGKGHGKGVDWWTLGVLIYEMLASYPPFYDEDPMKTYAKIVQGNIIFPSHFSKEAIDLVQKLMHHVPTKRLGVLAGGAKLVKAHPWFKDFPWDALLTKKLKAPIMPKVKNIEDMSNFERPPEGTESVEQYVDDGTNWDSDF